MSNHLYAGIRRPNGSFCAAHILINVIFSSGGKKATPDYLLVRKCHFLFRLKFLEDLGCGK